MRGWLAAAAAFMTIGAAGAAGAQTGGADKPPMSPELQKIVDAKTEKVMLSSTNPLVFGGQANLDAAKAWIKRVSASISISMSPMADRSASSARRSRPSSARQPSSVDIWTAASRNTIRC